MTDKEKKEKTKKIEDNKYEWDTIRREYIVKEGIAEIGSYAFHNCPIRTFSFPQITGIDKGELVRFAKKQIEEQIGLELRIAEMVWVRVKHRNGTWYEEKIVVMEAVEVPKRRRRKRRRLKAHPTDVAHPLSEAQLRGAAHPLSEAQLRGAAHPQSEAQLRDVATQLRGAAHPLGEAQLRGAVQEKARGELELVPERVAMLLEAIRSVDSYVFRTKQRRFLYEKERLRRLPLLNGSHLCEIEHRREDELILRKKNVHVRRRRQRPLPPNLPETWRDETFLTIWRHLRSTWSRRCRFGRPASSVARVDLWPHFLRTGYVRGDGHCGEDDEENDDDDDDEGMNGHNTGVRQDEEPSVRENTDECQGRRRSSSIAAAMEGEACDSIDRDEVEFLCTGLTGPTLQAIRRLGLPDADVVSSAGGGGRAEGGSSPRPCAKSVLTLSSLDSYTIPSSIATNMTLLAESIVRDINTHGARTRYVHRAIHDDGKRYMNRSTGQYFCDCSGFICHLLEAVTCMHLSHSYLSDRPYMRAKDFFRLFVSLPPIASWSDMDDEEEEKEAREASEEEEAEKEAREVSEDDEEEEGGRTAHNTMWRRVPSLDQVIPGDVVSWIPTRPPNGEDAFVDHGESLEKVLRQVGFILLREFRKSTGRSTLPWIVREDVSRWVPRVLACLNDVGVFDVHEANVFLGFVRATASDDAGQEEGDADGVLVEDDEETSVLALSAFYSTRVVETKIKVGAF
eukprot:g1469.t1